MISFFAELTRTVANIICGAIAAFAFLCANGNTALAQPLGPPPNTLVSERPSENGAPTSITVAVFFFEIDEIDDVKQQFTVDMFFRLTWRDPRLSLPEGERTGQRRTVPRNQVWTPRGLIINDRGLRLQLPQVVDIDDMGNVLYRQRVTGSLSFASKLSRFPFDVQQLPIDFVSYAYAPEEVVWSRESGVIGGSRALSEKGWKFRMLEPQFGEFSIPEEGIVRPRMTYRIEAQRDAQYFLLTLFLPMSLIVFMAWTVFWLHPDMVSSRIAISTAAIFSLIAFGFSIRLSLPQVSYLTLADVFVFGCTMLVFLALAVAVAGSRMVNAERVDKAMRLDTAARWAYLAVFCVIAVAVSVL